MRTLFYLASMDSLDFVPPRECALIEVVSWSKTEKVLRVQLDRPIPPEPYHQTEPIEKLLLSFCDVSQDMEDIGKKNLMVNILLSVPAEQMFVRAPVRIGIGTLHGSFEAALRSSPIEEDERKFYE